MKLGIIGAGGWGTTLAIVYSHFGHDVSLWSYDKDVISDIKENGINKYLTETIIDSNGDEIRKEIPIAVNFEVTNNIKKCVDNAEIIIHATPSDFAESIFEEYYKSIQNNASIIIATKGVLFNDKDNQINFISDFFREKLNSIDKKDKKNKNKIFALAGANIAGPIARLEKYSTANIAVDSGSIRDAVNMAEYLNNDVLRLIPSTFIKNIQINSTLKNIYTIGIATCIGLGISNKNNVADAKALALTEFRKITKYILGRCYYEAIICPSGIADLDTTIESIDGRNRTFGYQLGRTIKEGGVSVEQAINESYKKMGGKIVEGFKNTERMYKYLEKKPNQIKNLPFLKAIYNVLFKHPDHKHPDPYKTYKKVFEAAK